MEVLREQLDTRPARAPDEAPSAEEEPMRTHVRRTAQLGELIAAVFDKAARYSADPLEVSRLATLAVAHLLLEARRTSMVPSLPAA